ncbi:unnamed protein product [Phyllotreta striolata]|uniref:RING-type domain-containing protein n=1 Tax=Phyllotreta striolata TaxID=444603 RepID=A0A9N9XNZ1_PHYSR|nr:unnamed protein product [Phyllotreta striolata]
MSRRNTRSSKKTLVISDSEDETEVSFTSNHRASKKTPRTSFGRTSSGRTSLLFLNETVDDATINNFKSTIMSEVNSFFESGKLLSVFENDSDNLDKCEKSASSKRKHDCDEFEPSTSKTKVPTPRDANRVKEDELVSLVDVIDNLDNSDTGQSIDTDDWMSYRRNAKNLLKSVDDLLNRVDNTLGSCKDLFKDNTTATPTSDNSGLTLEVDLTVESVSDQPSTSQSTAEPPQKQKTVRISCPICLRDDDISFGATVCGHIFCMDCLPSTIKAKKCCPICRKKLTMKQYHPLFI